jgi:hypothetical protein
MKRTFPVFAALALGLAVPASAQEAAPPPPADSAAIEEPAPPPPESEAEPGAPRRERPRRPGFGPRRDGPEGAAGPRRDGPGGAAGPRRDGPGGAAGPRRDGPGAPGRGGFGMNEGGSLGFLVPLLQKPETAAKIGLPEEKAQALAATFADLDAQLKAANEKLPAAFKRQADALEATPVDEAAVLAAVNEVWDLRREVALLQTRKVLAIRASLSAEQIEKARALLKDEWRAFGERRGGDGPRRGPGGPGAPGGRRGPRPGDAPAEAPQP